VERKGMRNGEEEWREKSGEKRVERKEWREKSGEKRAEKKNGERTNSTIDALCG
jgi:hypothetical protein